MKVSLAYLGPKGTNSDTAALAYANWLETTQQQKAILHAYPSIALTLRSVVNQEVDLAIVPIENSIGGSVTITLDTLWEFDNLKIIQGLTLPIIHGLLTFNPSLSAIKTVYSHPQALAQCQKWLEQYLPEAKLIATSSTTEALQFLKPDPQAAAIAAPRAAAIYQIPLLKTQINDHPENCTRFWVVGLTPRKQGSQLSLAFSLPQNCPGALVQVLEIFAQRKLNLSKIESRPTKRSLGEYIFFIDVEGSLNDGLVQTALAEVAQHTELLKIFGNYDLLPMVAY